MGVLDIVERHTTENADEVFLPIDTTIPFFAYGLFQPGELGFLRLKEYTEGLGQNCSVSGKLMIRDGLPILVAADNRCVRGTLLFFRQGADAYCKIAELEPRKLYYWGTVDVSEDEGAQIKANVLFGRRPDKGAVDCEDPWSGKSDPLFRQAPRIIAEIENGLTDLTIGRTDWEMFFRAQMAYLLLWSAIERYASLRYHLGTDVVRKILPIAKESAFKQSLREVARSERKVFRADDPESPCWLRPIAETDAAELIEEKAKKALIYYSQVRHNIVHRGKAGTVPHSDYEHVRHSLRELVLIFEKTLAAAFEESRS